MVPARSSYRCLEYPFALDSNDASLKTSVERLLDVWAAPDAENADPYALLVRSTSDGGQWFSLELDGEELGVGPEPNDLVAQLLHAVSNRAFESATDVLLIHAGAVVAPGGGGVLLPGPSGVGKTTLVAALLRAGFGYLSDEAGALDPETRMLHAFARPLGIKGTARHLFEGANNGGNDIRYLTHDELRTGSMARPAPITHVIAPRYVPGASTTVTPMTPAETVLELGQSAMNLLRFGADGLELLARVARDAPGHRLVSGDLEEAVAAVRHVTHP